MKPDEVEKIKQTLADEEPEEAMLEEDDFLTFKGEPHITVLFDRLAPIMQEADIRATKLPDIIQE